MTTTEWRSILLMSFTADGSEQARVSLSGPGSAKRVGRHPEPRDG